MEFRCIETDSLAEGVYRCLIREVLLFKKEYQHLQCTLPETNIARENRPSQKETSLPTIHFQGYVSFREGIYNVSVSLQEKKMHLYGSS